MCACSVLSGYKLFVCITSVDKSLIAESPKFNSPLKYGKSILRETSKARTKIPRFFFLLAIFFFLFSLLPRKKKPAPLHSTPTISFQPLLSVTQVWISCIAASTSSASSSWCSSWPSSSWTRICRYHGVIDFLQSWVRLLSSNWA